MEGLPLDATVFDVFEKLTYPREYLALVRHKLLQCHREHGNAHVRIGIRGRGIKPCFRIFSQTAKGALIFGSFWDTGNPLVREDAESSNWSTSSSSFEEVDNFMRVRFAPKRQ